jgi:hypothetical protein
MTEKMQQESFLLLLVRQKKCQLSHGMVYISYNGENLGEFDESQIQEMLLQGQIDQGAYYLLA